jgi:hypothetical protein
MTPDHPFFLYSVALNTNMYYPAGDRQLQEHTMSIEIEDERVVPSSLRGHSFRSRRHQEMRAANVLQELT